ncbi:MAG: hypothetical protein ABEH35_04885 [Haloarculaceae archaeon]
MTRFSASRGILYTAPPAAETDETADAETDEQTATPTAADD